MAAIPNKISVIIPTTCEARRWASLNRAISSVISQENTEVELIVVVNGNRFDPDCYERLRTMPGLTVVYQEQGSSPLAVRFGRSLVTAPAFAFLDDDDEYLPGALWNRLQPLLADETTDYVVSNGYRCIGDQDLLNLVNIDVIHHSPLRALSAENWLTSCGSLFRSSSVSIEYFDGTTAYFEWTFLAYKLASTLKMRFIDVPTFRIHESPTSLSKSKEYRDAEIRVLAKILDLDLPSEVKQFVRVKMGRTYHRMSNHHLQQGNLRRAWRYHLASLFYPRGRSYIFYSRKLLPFPLGKFNHDPRTEHHSAGIRKEKGDEETFRTTEEQ